MYKISLKEKKITDVCINNMNVIFSRKKKILKAIIIDAKRHNSLIL